MKQYISQLGVRSAAGAVTTVRISAVTNGAYPTPDTDQWENWITRGRGVGVRTTTLQGQAITFSADSGATPGYIWFTVGGVGADPALPGTGQAVDLVSGDSPAAVAAAIAAQAPGHPIIDSAADQGGGDVDLSGTTLDPAADFDNGPVPFDDTSGSGSGDTILSGCQNQWGGTAADAEFGIESTYMLPLQMPSVAGRIVGVMVWRGSNPAGGNIRCQLYDGGLSAPSITAGSPPTNMPRMADLGESDSAVSTRTVWTLNTPVDYTASSWVFTMLTAQASNTTEYIRARRTGFGSSIDIGTVRANELGRWDNGFSNPAVALPDPYSPTEFFTFEWAIGISLVIETAPYQNGAGQTLLWGYRGTPAGPFNVSIVDDTLFTARQPAPNTPGWQLAGFEISLAAQAVNWHGSVVYFATDTYTDFDPITNPDTQWGVDLGEITFAGTLNDWQRVAHADIDMDTTPGGQGSIVTHAFWGDNGTNINFNFGTVPNWATHDGNPPSQANQMFEFEVTSPTAMPHTDPTLAMPAAGSMVDDAFDPVGPPPGMSFQPDNTPRYRQIFTLGAFGFADV